MSNHYDQIERGLEDVATALNESFSSMRQNSVGGEVKDYNLADGAYAIAKALQDVAAAIDRLSIAVRKDPGPQIFPSFRNEKEP